MKNLGGKVALITGAAGGLGQAQARVLMGYGCKIVATDLDGAAVQSLAQALGGDAIGLQQDVTDPDAWPGVIDAAYEAFGRFDILINNAGIAIVADIETCTLEQWNKVINVNLTSVFLGTQAAIRRMKDTGGSIINICSIESMIGEPIVPSYNASKGGVRTFTKSAALHCAQAGYPIRVNAVHPAFSPTALVMDAAAALGDMADAFMEEVTARHPMGRMVEPDEVAEAVAFLASDSSSYVNGSEVVVDGAYTAR